MCGIAGIVGEGAHRQSELLEDMVALLAHRGPDDSGLWCHGDAALGHRRLSILDLSTAGHQPMAAADGRYQITFNGEIYNYLEIKHELKAHGYDFRTQTDTEVLLAAYQQWGEKCVERFNGMWAFAIWDQKSQELFASRDRFGKKPFYYVILDGCLYFASEMKALLLNPKLGRTLNPQAVFDFCAERMISYGSDTFFKEISQLPPASSLVWKQGRLSIKTYWDLPVPSTDSKESTERLSFLLEDAVRLRLRADTPIGCLASGGLDSSVVAALMRKNQRASAEIHLFTTQTDPPTEEAQGVEWLLKKGGFKAHVHTPDARLFWNDLPQLLWHQEEPFADGSMAAHYALMREARRANIPVLLTGQGADEVFAGYPSYLWAWLASRLRKGALGSLLAAARHQSLPYRNILFHALPAGLQTVIRHARTKRQLRWMNKDLQSLPRSNGHPEDLRELDALALYLRQSISTRTLPGFLHYEDRNSMAFGVETRLPFLDFRVVEALFRMPVR